MPSLGPPELIIILVIVMLIFGAGKLTDIGKSLGQGIREFRHSVQDDPDKATPSAPPVNSASSAPPGSTPIAPAATSAPAPGTPPAAAVANKCARCGAELQTGTRFCPACGQAVAG
jgi:sec-independent protein translocase protein TatA